MTTVRVMAAENVRAMHGLAGDEYGIVVDVEGAVVQFMLGGDQSPETADNRRWPESAEPLPYQRDDR
jgi:hypothetical protein